MKVRFGTYTVYNGIEMTLTEYYGHGLTQEIDEKHRIISYPQEYGIIEGFKLNEETGQFYRDILLEELTNAFFVTTKAEYNGEIFELEPYFGDEIHLHLATKNLDLGSKLGFYELHDGKGKPYYLGEVKKNEVKKIWEERTPSNLNVPMPEKIELIKPIN